VSRLSEKYERLDVSQPYGPPRPVTGILFYSTKHVEIRHSPSGNRTCDLMFDRSEAVFSLTGDAMLLDYGLFRKLQME
jgi:hypothetical protein